MFTITNIIYTNVTVHADPQAIFTCHSKLVLIYNYDIIAKADIHVSYVVRALLL